FPLEVDDHPVAIGSAKRLTEVQIAVVADLLQTAEPGQRLGEIGPGRGTTCIAEGGTRALQLIADRGIPRREVGVGDRLGSEVRVIRAASERQVETAGHFTQTPDGVQRRSTRPELVEQPLPAVASPGDELLQDGERGHASLAIPVLELSEETWRICEARVLGEEPGHLGFGIETVGEPPEG